jgi:hypothetical protein
MAVMCRLIAASPINSDCISIVSTAAMTTSRTPMPSVPTASHTSFPVITGVLQSVGDDQHHPVLRRFAELGPFGDVGVDAGEHPAGRIQQRGETPRQVPARIERRCGQVVIVQEHLERILRVELDEAESNVAFGPTLSSMKASKPPIMSEAICCIDPDRSNTTERFTGATVSSALSSAFTPSFPTVRRV